MGVDGEYRARRTRCPRMTFAVLRSHHRAASPASSMVLGSSPVEALDQRLTEANQRRRFIAVKTG